MHFLLLFLATTTIVTALMLAGAWLLHFIPTLGEPGQQLSAWLCRAPGLDVLVTYFTVAPIILGPIAAHWAGFFGGVAGQVIGVLAWVYLHERAHPEAVRGPRIVKVVNRLIGRWQNHVAIWLTAIVTPMFWIVRMAEIFIYPLIACLTGFPQYKGSQWVRVSRHKFAGLVGHDLIWCLYCDWMTGIWSLGTEMLRNVESFWCPIRFSHTGKCENCAIDFPDLNNGWVDDKANMAQVAKVLEDMHGGGTHAWFGHPVRLTVKGKAPS
ncbi:MAG: hypothetical protein ABSH22_21600 [Tepidisphaeraceae bacterium]|jgi:hypothetical protein